MILGGLLLLLVSVKGGVEESIDRTAGERQKHDQIQDEILKAMKDSGVLNEWKDKLDDLLYQGNEVEDEGKVKNLLNPQEESMVTSFVEAYTQEKNIDVEPSTILDIVRRVQKTPSPNLAQIFVQLSPLIDVVSAIQKKTTKLQNIIDRQAPVFESPAKTKDILHTLTENLKSELVRLTLDSAPPKAKTKTKTAPPPPPKKKEKKTGLDISDYLSLGSTLLKGGNAGTILSLLSGETDMSSMMSLLPQLIENGNYKDLLSKMVLGYLESSPYGALIKNMMQGWLDSEQGKSIISSGYKYLEIFVKSESGARLTKILPKLLQTKDMDAVLKLVHEEAEFNWSQVFENIENSDYKEKSLQQCSEYIVYAYEFITSPPKGSMAARAPILMNGVLMSNGVPPFDSNKPVESISAILNKGIKLFSTLKLDVTPYVQVVVTAASQAFARQAKGNSFSDLDTTQRTHLLARLIDAELVEPLQAVWSVYSHSVRNLDCASHLLCQVNYHERESGVESRIGLVKLGSLAVSWTLAQVKNKAGANYWNLYKVFKKKCIIHPNIF
ncbi:uncharacterized protein LOC111705791 isoform X2 [Eurytemora carolleeae]|uniref:uncharacterized protein LOC111705791 isoform X2 n=1 Tax=Eurytemora carolleeae TaxID=1294199 RepID=UPI000C788E92|nr:uncharacterized protein LOC111705791 isoform X2 [Eurytemora carolleeae]|eukprot:XP_023334226.1 uncharacterized protein LOC111705791 isoform X2 [Eurytemora affinis]